VPIPGIIRFVVADVNAAYLPALECTDITMVDGQDVFCSDDPLGFDIELPLWS
jgi:hypothetical protein